MPCITDEKDCGECKTRAECRVYYLKAASFEKYCEDPERHLTPDAIRLCYCCSLDYIKKGYEPLMYGFQVPNELCKK